MTQLLRCMLQEAFIHNLYSLGGSPTYIRKISEQLPKKLKFIFIVSRYSTFQSYDVYVFCTQSVQLRIYNNNDLIILTHL